MATRVGVISDTHISSPARVIPSAIWSIFAEVDVILHAGDLVSATVLRELSALCPVHAVHGNCDPPDVSVRLPEKSIVTVEGVRIGLTHGHLGTGRSTPDNAYRTFVADSVQCIVFGHSHEPYNQQRDGILLFNPGSALERRRQPRTSCGLLHVDGPTVCGEIIWL